MHVHTSHHPPHVLRTFARRKDPTNTQSLRRSFEKEMIRRFNEIRRLIKQAFIRDDVMGLKTNAASVPGTRAFEFLRLDEKVPAFMEWLKSAEDQAIFSVVPGTPIQQATNQAWMNLYIESAYQKGMAQSAANLRGQGVKVEDTWLDTAFFRPIHADRVGLIYTRTYSDLVGVTDQMDTMISRVLARGLSEGRNPNDIARDLVKQVDISRSRARTIARTEVISAHAEASLNSYKEAGLEGVRIRAEWSTAGDDAVCPECEAMEGKEFNIDDAHGLIPLHPNCRCAFIPVVLNPDGSTLGSTPVVPEKEVKQRTPPPVEGLSAYKEEMGHQLSLLGDMPAGTSAAVRQYRRDSRMVNGYLRNPTVMDAADQVKSAKLIDRLSPAFVPTESRYTVYRGLKSGSLPLPADFNEAKAMIGKTYSDPAFLSTAFDKSTRWSNEGGIMFKIDVPAGTRAVMPDAHYKGATNAYRRGLTKFEGENELMLPPGTKFEIIDVGRTPSTLPGRDFDHVIYTLRILQ